jgi:biopolymer transport protein ExbD
MRKRIKTGPSEASVDLTPMLDVVFILLIFFIVTSTFIQEKTLGLEPPPPPVLVDPPPPSAVIVYLDQDGLIRVNGQLTLLDGVRAKMERLRAENPDFSLLLQTHPKASSGMVIRLRDEAYSAKIERVNIVRSVG